MLVRALLACHNRRDTTLRCLAALSASRLPLGAELHIHIFDDASSDGTTLAVRRNYPHVSIIEGDGNAYWAGGMRALYDSVAGLPHSHLLLLNDDVVVEPDALIRALGLDQSHTNIGAVVGAVRDGNQVTYGGRVRRHSRTLRSELMAIGDTVEYADTFNGNFVLLRKTIVEEVGFFDAAFTHGMADTDLGFRLTEAGFPLAVLPGWVGVCTANSRRPGTLRDLVGPHGRPPREYALHCRRNIDSTLVWPAVWASYYVKGAFAVLWNRLLRRERSQR